MTTLATPSSALPARAVTAAPPIRAGAAVAPEAFGDIRRRMILHHCKWDPQVGDVSTLAPFPLILSADAWQSLSAAAEAMTRETLALEDRLLDRPDLHAVLGLPWPLRRVLRRARTDGAAPAAARVMRFDFHPTCDGWRVSEVNSDVPGGFTEASALSAMMAEHCADAGPAGDPLSAYADALARHAGAGDIVLLSAAGFMEDHQVIAGLAHRLRERGVASHLAQPHHLKWNQGRARLEAAWHCGPVGAIVRFYQGEWLCGLPRRTGWMNLFTGGETAVANPGIAIVSESKRLPLVWDALDIPVPAWRQHLSETRDPRDAAWRRDAEEWVLKTAFCNTGDAVILRERMSRRRWLATHLEVRLNPRQWIAQRRFDVTAIETPAGMMFPCIGVYTIEGHTCGAYARLSPTPVITYAAIDAAVLVETGKSEADR